MLWQRRASEGRPGAGPGSPLTGRYCILSKDNSSPSQSHSQRERGVGRGRHQATPIWLLALHLWHLRAAASILLSDAEPPPQSPMLPSPFQRTG